MHQVLLTAAPRGVQWMVTPPGPQGVTMHDGPRMQKKREMTSTADVMQRYP